MILAALDIGSNAARFQISRVIEYRGQLSFKKIEFIRYPLRLGEDVFINKEISEKRLKKIIQLCKICQQMMKLYEVDMYVAYATSAMREATNAEYIKEKVLKKSGINIEVIDGHKEAFLINKVIQQTLDEQNYIHIDVGGGSTELNIYSKREKIFSESFRIGTVRNLKQDSNVTDWNAMKAWVKGIVEEYSIDYAIGTGGNIRKLHELAGQTEGRAITRTEIESLKEYLARFTMEERVNILMLNADRADVILPASDIYSSVMKWSKTKKIFVPAIGLKDGMFLELYEKIKGQDAITLTSHLS